MKHTKQAIMLILCLFGLLFTTVQAQEYVKEIKTEKDDFMRGNSIVLNDSTRLIVYGKGHYNEVSMANSHYTIRIMGLNTRTGSLEEKVSLPDSINGYNIYQSYSIFNDSIHKRYILIATAVLANDHSDPPETQAAIVHVSYDYKVIFDTLIGEPNISELPYTRTLTDDGYLLMAVNDANMSVQNYRVFLWKTDIYGNMIASNTVNPQLLLPRSIFDIPSQACYVLLFDNGSIYNINKTNLGIESIIDLSQNYIDVMGAKYNRKTKMLETCMVHYYKQVSSGAMKSYVAWDTINLEHPQITPHFIAIPYESEQFHSHNNMYRQGNDIFLLNSLPTNMLFNGIFWPYDNAVLLQKYDITGVPLWSRSYFSMEDGCAYYALCLFPDANDDIIIFASRYILGSSYPQRDLVYFKVDKETGNMIPWDE